MFQAYITNIMYVITQNNNNKNRDKYSPTQQLFFLVLFQQNVSASNALMRMNKKKECLYTSCGNICAYDFILVQPEDGSLCRNMLLQ